MNETEPTCSGWHDGRWTAVYSDAKKALCGTCQKRLSMHAPNLMIGAQLPPMPPEVRRLVREAELGLIASLRAACASVHSAPNWDGWHRTIADAESAIAAVRRIYRSEP